MNKTDFINAYICMFGTTKKHAATAWKTSDNNYKKAVIDAYKNNTKKSFYND